MKVTKDKWVWMPHPAHFICSDRCRFFLATKVGKYIISTVGEYWPDSQVRKIHAEIHDKKWYLEQIQNDVKGDAWDYAYMQKFGFESLGMDRLYETMVFKAEKMPEDIGCGACPFKIESGSNIDFEGYNDAKEAYKGHMKMCRKYANK